MNIEVKENSKAKVVRSESYNYNFDKKTGFFQRWGKTTEDDPVWAPGNEIADIEISTICNGGCKFCYKSNTPNGKNMSFETFKNMLDKMLKSNKFLTQIAFGSGSTGEENPDMWKMMEYCREKGIIPNITVADISDETADRLVKYCGAVAVSRYENKNKCYDSVKKLTDRGLTQCNIHQMICDQTYEQTLETLEDIKTDDRLKKLNAIVLLSLKTKGRAKSGFTPLSQENFELLVDLCFKEEHRFGFDSCGSAKLVSYLEDKEELKNNVMPLIEPCESLLFSYFINVDAMGFPCSFAENTEDWIKGLDIINCENFIKDVWLHPISLKFRKRLLECERSCPLYKV